MAKSKTEPKTETTAPPVAASPELAERQAKAKALTEALASTKFVVRPGKAKGSYELAGVGLTLRQVTAAAKAILPAGA